MLTSCKLKGAAQAVAKYHTKEENYYFSQAGGVESVIESASPAPSHVLIYGKLAARLGYSEGQAITEEQLTGLLSGRDAKGAPAGRKHEVIGIDLTFSAPKSVSVAALLTEKDPRIIKAHDEAVLETLREIEAKRAGTQLFKAKEKKILRVKTGNMAFVTVRDGFNRNHEPHLHTHSVVANMTDYKGRIMALDGKQIMAQDFNKLWGGLYRMRLAAKLRELGYGISYTKHGEWRLDCVSLEVEKAFSSRRAEIKALVEQGMRSEQAWRETRKGKNPETVKQDVVMSWQETLKHFPQKAAEVNRMEALAAGQQWFKEARWSVEARQELAGERGPGEIGRWQVAARRATEDRARVGAEAIIGQYLTELARSEKWEPMSYAQAESRFEEQVRLGHIFKTDEGFYTTWEMMRVDRQSVAARPAPESLVMSESGARRAVEQYCEDQKRDGRQRLSPVQIDAAVGVLSSAEGTVLVQGDAGSGKTTMLRAVRGVAEAEGWEVVGSALQGMAAKILEDEAGIKSLTLASYLAQEKAASDAGGRGPGQGRRRLVVVDEAGMLGSRQAAELQESAARRGDKVVLVGDHYQLLSIGAGAPFERLVKTAEASGRLLGLHENYRQKTPQLKAAVDFARAGNMEESLRLFNEMNCVQQIPDAVMRRDAIAKLYDARTLIIAGTNEGRDDLNVRIRERLLKAGTLDANTARTYEVSYMDRDGVSQKGFRRIAVGEPIIFLTNEYDQYDVRNGERAIVTKTSPTHLSVRHDDGRELQLDVGRYNAFDYGYAVVTYKSQGMSVDRVVIEADMRVPYLQDRRNTYVQITRAKESAVIFTDDFWELKDAAAIMSAKRDTLDLGVTAAEAQRKEERLKEMARNEVMAKGLAGQAYAPRAVVENAAQDAAPRESVGMAQPIEIHNEILMKSAGGHQPTEKEYRGLCAELAEHINRRVDLRPDEKTAMAEFLSRRECVLLVGEQKRVEAKIAAVEIALELRSPAQACRDLTDAERKSVDAEVSRLSAHGRERDRGKDRGRGFSAGL